MNLKERINTLTAWGDALTNLPSQEWNAAFESAENKNRWFTNSNCKQAVDAILLWLNKETLLSWAKNYQISDAPTGKIIGIVMAGNIPLVGFHDFLCVLISGHNAKVKLSSQDDVLLPFLTNILISVDNQWKGSFSFEDRLNNIDAVISTGSDNSARYFEYYFRNIPKIIRKNRTSIGIIMGDEPVDEFIRLSRDVFSYFGMGCRNVSKIFIPDGFEIKLLQESFEAYTEIINHNKYGNNYDYQRAIRLVSGKPFTEFGNLILEESKDLVSPIAVLYYQFYSNQDELKQFLSANQEKLQCVVSVKGWFTGSLPFGEAQSPGIDDYADGVDTMRFLNTSFRA